ncbi:MAG: type II secretion system F family protein [Kiloniellales bacterium]|nr:type II secretion system F family protein [Kiloniellales bacterium]
MNPFESIGQEEIVIAMAGLSALVMTIAVWSALVVRDPSQRRMKEMVDRRLQLKEGIMVTPRRRQKLQATTMMRQVVDRLKLLRTAQADKLARRLAQAGWRSKDAVVRFLFAKLALPFVFGGVALFVLYVLELYNLDSIQKMLVVLGLTIFGTYAPEIYVKNTIQKRWAVIRKALPDALDLMVICAEAGLSLDATMQRVSDELAGASPELSEEFGLTAAELSFLPDRTTALGNLKERVDLPAMRGLVNSLVQSERYGTPLAQSLRVLAAESRNERVMKAEEKAARLPAMLTVPMIIFILPPLFIVLIGPAGLDIADALGRMG